MDYAADFASMKTQLEDTQERVRLVMMWRALRASEEWQRVENWLQKRVDAKAKRLMVEDLDIAGFRELRAEMRAYSDVLELPRTNDQQIEKWQSDIAHLQKRLAQRQNIGLDKNYPVEPEGQPT